jgi:hypothetical protein
MNLGKIIVLQVAIVLTKLSSQYPVHLFIILVSISKQKHCMTMTQMTMYKSRGSVGILLLQTFIQ